MLPRHRSVTSAYILWGLGGVFGLHHLYLGRYRQAFLWISTLGGFLGLGWVRDAWRMPEYVAQCNAETDYVEEFVETMKRHWRPPLSITRMSAEVAFGALVGVAVVAGLPQDIVQGKLGTAVMCGVVPLATGLAVDLVANIGREKSGMQWAIGGAYVANILLAVSASNPISGISQSAIAATVATNWKGKSWRRTKYKKFSKSLGLRLFFGLLVYSSLWFSSLYHNAYITTQDGERVPLRVAIGNIMTSDAWKHPLDTLRHIWATYGASGFDRTWGEFVSAIDPEGERSAYQVLGIGAGATEKEIRAAYRDLVKVHHPDRVSDPEQKTQREVQFIIIQKAYETLSAISNRRAKANRVDRSGPDERNL